MRSYVSRSQTDPRAMVMRWTNAIWLLCTVTPAIFETPLTAARRICEINPNFPDSGNPAATPYNRVTDALALCQTRKS